LTPKAFNTAAWSRKLYLVLYTRTDVLHA
jgi:hypothetical protein